jgi:hypothetical protein
MGRLPVVAAVVDRWRHRTLRDAFDRAKDRLLVQETDKGVPFVPALDVKILAIPEPGKFRIISKGDGFLYSALQPLQGLLLQAWKRCSASTMLEDDLSSAVQRIDEQLDLPFWCSVDYEAATDLLKRDATLAAFEGLPSRTPFRDLGYLSLMIGRAFYPDGTVKKLSEGQLMGHPLSFPLLCLINLAVYHTSITRWISQDPVRRRTIGLSMLPHVLVNGDDMLFKCERSFYDVFVRTASDAGFKISQGKQYLSPDCCMINSQVFIRRSLRMVRVGYLNLKLVYGESLKTGSSAATPVQVGKDLSKMVRLCPWTNCAVPFALNGGRTSLALLCQIGTSPRISAVLVLTQALLQNDGGSHAPSVRLRLCSFRIQSLRFTVAQGCP